MWPLRLLVRLHHRCWVRPVHPIPASCSMALAAIGAIGVPLPRYTTFKVDLEAAAWPGKMWNMCRNFDYVLFWMYVRHCSTAWNSLFRLQHQPSHSNPFRKTLDIDTGPAIFGRHQGGHSDAQEDLSWCNFRRWHQSEPRAVDDAPSWIFSQLGCFQHLSITQKVVIWRDFRNASWMIWMNSFAASLDAAGYN